MEAAATQATPARAELVRARGLTPLWVCVAVAFLLCSLVIGVIAGPVDIGVGGIVSTLAVHLHIPGATSSSLCADSGSPEAVSAALVEYVKRRKQLRILDAFGTVDFDPKYDYKTERNRKRP